MFVASPVSVLRNIAVLSCLLGCASRPVDRPSPARGGSADHDRTGDSAAADPAGPQPDTSEPVTEAPEIARALADLEVDDFVTYAAGARRLVSMGEAAIPALGRAADRKHQRGAASVLRAILLRIDTRRVARWFAAPWPTVRAMAARSAGERHLLEHAGALVGLLEDEEVGVRRAAVGSLRRLSSRFFGFQPDASASRRAASVRRWREFWAPGAEDRADQGAEVSYDGDVKLDAAQGRLLLDRLEHGVCLLDRDGVVCWANAAMGKQFGTRELAGRPFAEAVPALADALDWSQAATNAIERGRLAQLARQALPASRHVNCLLAPVDLGDASYALLSITDVSENVELEQRLLRQARTQAIANLGDSIAHEIRNPLNSIHMNVQLLREGLKEERLDRERFDRTAAIVLSEIKRLDRVVRDFVQFSRPPALQLVAGSVNHVVRAAVDALDAQIREKSLELEVDLQSARPVSMDRDRLQQAFYNVLLNAVQVLPEGGRITCHSRDAERRCLVEIADDGPGLDAGRCAHIFDVFYTTKAGGTGLGLPIANRIVEEHGGRVAVQSAPGRGTTFAFFLPYDAAPTTKRGPTAVLPGEGR